MARRTVQSDPSKASAPPAEVADDDHGIEMIDDDDRALVLEGLEQSRRGEIASDEDVEAVLARFRR
ncbi:hypothetical protein [Lichenibacterium dinghuense]|uniref:hypothetical protein n=1 Tax=Lichenibacterium dinghuense TaxID=2895977 RepID=UPI001F47AA24|nr:hypothetical protein [Lichenibacterium sp. 6Y81]